MPPQQRPGSGLAAKKPATRQAPRRVGPAVTERVQSPANPLKPTNANAVRAIKSPTSQSVAGAKRKERDFEPSMGEDTSIHVVVRSRGRNERETKENSAVVVSVDGVKGKTIEVSMGPNALSNKTYHFDRVFSPAADQATIFEEVVAPMLNEMLSGYNCTIFAYGQTGTGKTYTMSGDMTDTLGILSDNAGIIPRVLYRLFQKLEDTEHTVKCSFIELYNEELRDLLAYDEKSNLKIYDNENKKGQANSTMVQGMEETYIDSASAGIKLLQKGSHRRQVAATKCNDLSSRSHTIFTITTQVKRTTDTGEEYICQGKLNLVDLAGSENIQRSGADSKRAAEAGLINKSLLTLGRVINALVDKSPHIPYRESKLTRLLQDSLGGQTKTCIIATVSPARSNLEETISTLDYAFRAKNIRNKPQINSTLPKKTVLNELTVEIEKLKSELIATRHRNGVYLPTETYEELKVESESRRIINEEQRAKIESMEASLKHKLQELFTLTSNFNNLKQENKETREKLEQTNDLLERTEIILQDTRNQLEQEEMLRKAHQETEEQLHGIGSELLSKLEKTVEHVNGLHNKLRRKSDLSRLNRETWEASTADVVDVTRLVDNKFDAFHTQHSALIENLSQRITSFVASELQNVDRSRSKLAEYNSLLGETENRFTQQASQARDEMNEVLEEIKVLREDVKRKVGEGLNGLSTAAERISKEVIGELVDFHTQLHASYSSLGNELKAMFEKLVEHIKSQKTELDELRDALLKANQQTIEANRTASSELQRALEEEREQAALDQAKLLSQIKELVEESAQAQRNRLRNRVSRITSNITSSGKNLEAASRTYREGMNGWVQREDDLVKEVTTTRDTIKNRMQSDWTSFEQRNESIQKATEAVHEETIRIVDAQMQGMATQMEALDDFVTRARSQNDNHYEAHMDNLRELTGAVRGSYEAFDADSASFSGRMRSIGAEVGQTRKAIDEVVTPFSTEVRQSLDDLRNNIQAAPMAEYEPTGTTPPRMTYEYPTNLPRTESHRSLLAKFKQARNPEALESLDGEESSPNNHPLGSPSKTQVYHDHTEDEVSSTTTQLAPLASSSNTGLREVDVNVAASRPTSSSADGSGNSIAKLISTDETLTKHKLPYHEDEEDIPDKDENMIDELEPPPAKKQKQTPSSFESKLPQKKTTRRMATSGILPLEGRENDPVISTTGIPGGRRLRSHPASG